MNTNTTNATEMLTTATKTAHEGLLSFENLLRSLSDADLHRADTEGGWTVAQLVSHIHLCGLLWIADLERMRADAGKARQGKAASETPPKWRCMATPKKISSVTSLSTVAIAAPI